MPMPTAFAPLPPVPDYDALERAVLAWWDEEKVFERLRAQIKGGPHFSFIDGPATANKTLGVHTAWGRTPQGRLPALQGCAGLRPAISERVRLSGPVDRSRRRTRARPQLQEGDRGVRAGEVRPQMPRKGRLVGGRTDTGLATARILDGLGRGLPDVLRHQYRIHLALPPDPPGAGPAVPGPPFDAVVPAVWDFDVSTRDLDVGRVSGEIRSVPVRTAEPPRPCRRVARGLDDYAVDAACKRRGGRAPRA